MDHRKLVLPEHLNDQGSLFGGYLLKWLDEFAYISANMDFPGREGHKYPLWTGAGIGEKR